MTAHYIAAAVPAAVLAVIVYLTVRDLRGKP
jgi:hypothetical protein